MCGIIGIVAQQEVKKILINTISGVQHRGQQAAGIATIDGNLMHLKKGLGLAREVITPVDLSYLNGNSGIAHVRYPTAGSANNPEEAQPFYVNSPFGIMLAHNGNLTNTENLRNEVLYINKRHVRTKSDSEVLTNIFAFELNELTSSNKLNNKAIFQAITNLHSRINGGYAVVSLIANYGLIGFRDPFGIRPMVLGRKILPSGIVHILASESCTLTINGFELVRDVLPGETILITLDGKIETKICHSNPSLNICIFEYVYLARADSIMEQVPVQLARQNMGKYLAKAIGKDHSDLTIDIVIPIPDTARITAIAVAEQLNKPYREGFVLNQYVGRTFIINDPEQRRIAVHNKLSPIALEFAGKNVLLVDDSIVRGSTAKEIISILKQAGAKKVYIASASPEVKYPNVYGIDMPTYSELIAYQRSSKEIASILGADKVIYQSLEDLQKSITDINPEIKNFDASCFNGNYITGSVSNEYLLSLAHGIVHA